MTSVSFKSKYIAVAVVAAILVSLAVGGVLMYENRVQHSALLGSTAADSRNRLAGELGVPLEEPERLLPVRLVDDVEGDQGDHRLGGRAAPQLSSHISWKFVIASCAWTKPLTFGWSPLKSEL